MKTPSISKLETRTLSCQLTDKEKLSISLDLAECTSMIARIEAEKKSINADFKSKSEAKKARINELVQKIETGAEHRDVECEVFFHEPKPRHKRIVRTDTGAEVEVLVMTGQDLQQELPIEEAQATKAPKKKAASKGKVVPMVEVANDA